MSLNPFFLRFIPAYVKLREELANRSLGDIYNVNVQFGEVITSDRVFKKELGGGSILDIGIYCVQVLSQDEVCMSQLI
jgi:dihydrodiol dehydrogenase / D-xylose 1-dehydrogenase (NADP)